MEGERAGRGRLRAGLPNGARLSHTAGSTATDVGFTPATNDIGVATLPNGARYAIAAFLAGSTATEPQRDALFADAAKLIVKAAGQG
jgi:beta-lactamase class A